MTRCHSVRSTMCTGPPPATPAAVTTASMRPCSCDDRGDDVAHRVFVAHVAGRERDRVGRPRPRAGATAVARSMPTTRAPSRDEARDARLADTRCRTGHERNLAGQSHERPLRSRSLVSADRRSARETIGAAR